MDRVGGAQWSHPLDVDVAARLFDVELDSGA